MAERFPATLLAALADLMKWLNATRMPSMVIGGVAASFLGKPRFTQDVDALAILPEADWAAAMTGAAKYGIVPRIDNALGFARRTRVLLMQHAASGIDIDLTFGGIQFEHEAINNCTVHDIEGVRIRLPQVEDLLIMKAVAHRPKDMLDIEGLLETHPEVDVKRVRRWVTEFSIAMSMSEMLDGFDRLLARLNTRGKARKAARSKRKRIRKSAPRSKPGLNPET